MFENTFHILKKKVEYSYKTMNYLDVRIYPFRKWGFVNLQKKYWFKMFECSREFFYVLVNFNQSLKILYIYSTGIAREKKFTRTYCEICKVCSHNSVGRSSWNLHIRTVRFYKKIIQFQIVISSGISLCYVVVLIRKNISN